MEDVCYFLVGKVERSAQAAKRILPTYPCLQPSESTAFRTALTKYVEMLRNRVVRPESQPVLTSSNNAKNKKDHATTDAWWWKDTVVRKSIIEECSGDRFERLLIALSTHAIWSSSRPTSADTIHADENTALVSLQELPMRYASLVVSSQSYRLAWERTAALLLQRQHELDTLRRALTDPKHKPLSRYASIATDRLVELCASRKADLLRDGWVDADGQKALDFLLDLANLKDVERTPQHISSGNSEPLTIQAPAPGQSPPAQPLATAAAHHPSHLKALTTPLLPRTSLSTDTDHTTADTAVQSTTTSLSMNITLRERSHAAERSKTALEEALRRMRIMGQGLDARLEKAQARVQAAVRPDVVLDLPVVNNAGLNVDFEAPTSLDPPAKTTPKGPRTVEEHMHHILMTELSQYPTIPSKPTISYMATEAAVTRDVPSRPGPSRSQTTGPLRITKSRAAPARPEITSRVPLPSPIKVRPTPTTIEAERIVDSMNESTTSSNFNITNRTPKASRTLKRPRLIPLSATSDPFSSRPSSARPAESAPVSVEEIPALLDEEHMVDIGQGSESVDIVEPGREVKAETEVQELAEIASVASEGSAVSEQRDGEDVGSETDAPFSESVAEEEEETREDDEVYEGKSMSLRDILVQAGDATFAQYDLLAEDDEDLADQTFGWD
ncbi:uncharacterized protein STEHIDRAFT_154237 [Stereum hirsutum FP-91666 SS1]|uniref:uncharacterized protein n=1 Tax=Stereum hirsutum (strain FP-91666) TaxID=721885 RepID=UPI000440EEC6|nr:uncharacterized protein STEHIDRAFT_154237 [Stereum hirsutum FP-91666 SS1]EIM90412.1 hypothetical protein STEHIDRAFT_154237 [Stereum hirsutum FP-91666 SS1]